VTDIRAVIFDLDGTLADTLADVGNALDHVLVELGLSPHPLQQHRANLGWGVQRLVERTLPDADAALIAETVRRFRAYYSAHLIVDTAPYPEIPDVLDHLTGRVQLAVNSNKPHADTCRVIVEVFARWQFADVVGARNGVPKKPDPAAALEQAAKLGVAPAQCAFVGDTDVDIRTAVAAGMLPLGAGWGFRDGSSLGAAGAAKVLASPRQLLAVLDV